MENTASQTTPTRTVSPLLAIGIALLPGIFVWFLLRDGHSDRSRILGFGWAGLLLASVYAIYLAPRIATPGVRGEETAAEDTKAAPKKSAAELAAAAEAAKSPIRELSLLAPSTAGSAGSAKLSRDASQMRSLWAELEGFRYDPAFHVLGFEPYFRFAEWEGKVRTLDARAGREIQKEIGLTPNELIDLASEYQRNRGKVDQRGEQLLQRFVGMLNPAARKKGEGRIINPTQGCEDFDAWARSNWALETGEFEDSNRLLDEARCSSIAEGMVVGAPTRRREFDWKKEEGSRVAVLVRFQGSNLWVPEDDVSY